MKKIDEMSLFRKVMFIVALGFTTMVSDAMLVYTPLLNDMYAAFPDQEGLINQFVSLPSLFLVIFTLLAPVIMRLMGHKPALMTALVVALVSGVGMAFIANPVVLVVLNCLCSCAQGVVNTACFVILVDYVASEQTSNRYIGIYSTILSVFVIVLPLISGVLATGGWQMGFQAYWLFVIPVVLCIFFVPSAKSVGVEKMQKKEKVKVSAEEKKSSPGFTGRFIIFVILLVFFYTLDDAYTWYYSFFVDEWTLGDTAFAGVVGSCMGVGSIAGNLFYTATCTALKKNMGVVGFALVAIGCFIVFISHTAAAAIIAVLLLGIALGIFYPYAVAVASATCGERVRDVAISMVTAASGICGFLVPYYISIGMNITGGYTALMLPTAIIMLVVTIVEFATSRKDKTNAGIDEDKALEEKSAA